MEEPSAQPHRTRSLDRITAFTDGAVAIALTLLVLPLVDLAQSTPAGDSVSQLFTDNSGDLLAFAVSFLAIAQFWAGHRRMYEGLVDYSELLLTLNTFWLLAIVFLPFPTARLFVESKLTPGSAVLYLGTMLAISLLALAQYWWILRHPVLLAEPVRQQLRADRAAVRRRLLHPATIVVTFLVATLVAVVAPVPALYLLLVLPVVERLARFRPPATR